MSEILFARLDELNAAVAGIVSHGTFFAPTLTGAITFLPTYQSANPGNAGIYGLIGNSPVGATTIYNAIQISQGAPIPAAQQFRSNSVGVQQAVVGTTQNLAGDLTTYHLAGGAFYALTNQAAGIGIAATVGVFGQAMTNVANASVFGGNVVAMNSSGVASAFGFDMNYIVGLEIDVNMTQKVGNINPTAVGGHVYGLIIAGDSTLTAPIVGSSAIAVDRLSVNTNVPWYYGFSTYDNGTVIGVSLGAAGTGNNVNSQPIQMTGRNAGGNARIVDFHADANGALILAPDSNSGVTAILDGIGLGAAFQVATVFSNTHINIPSLTTAGVITNNVSGSFVSTTSLSTTLGGLGANNAASNGVPLFAAGVVTMTATSGTGNFARVSSPTFITPALGTPSALVGTNITGTASGLTAGTVTTNANLTGDIISTGNATTFTGKTGGALGQIPGTVTNDNASTGNVGEYVESAVASPGVSLSNTIAANVTSIPLPAGDWNVVVNGAFLTGATTSITQIIVGISSTSNTLDLSPGKFSVQNFPPTVFGAVNQSTVVQSYRLSLASPTTIYFVVRSTFTVSTVSAWGIISARRAR